MRHITPPPTPILCALILMAFIAASGCTRRDRTPPEPTAAVTTHTHERAVIVRNSNQGSQRYYRDENGKLYYVDQGGAIHEVERSARVERGTAGLYYIIDDDNVTYKTDESGRLYYRDTSSGRAIYVEDSGAGKVIDPLPILRGGSYPRIEHVRSLDYCNDAWRRCTSECDNSPGLNNKRNCFDNCDYQREQCLKPY
ncbi:hypothetical protein [Fundidesulfovibrio soli]|uniref:hypothetical protein n=1 Tax=Fundidesulfovibrio soli TaxID=2922716 RepID=UPI001FAE7E57|nr:hypothetical protein [Fundidesulfovibrio soli]